MGSTEGTPDGWSDGAGDGRGVGIVEGAGKGSDEGNGVGKGVGAGLGNGEGRILKKKYGNSLIGKDVDHKDRNPRNNSMSNLRLQSKSVNRSRNQ